MANETPQVHINMTPTDVPAWERAQRAFKAANGHDGNNTDVFRFLLFSHPCQAEHKPSTPAIITNRIGRALAQMVVDGDVSHDEADAAAHTMSGGIWDKAVYLAYRPPFRQDLMDNIDAVRIISDRPREQD